MFESTHTRRSVVLSTGTLAITALAGCSGGGGGEGESESDGSGGGGTDTESDSGGGESTSSGDGSGGTPGFDGWLSNVGNYDGVADETGSSEVTVYTVTVEAAEPDSTDGLREVAYGDLPETDRERFGPILSGGDPPDPETAVGIDYGTAEEVGNDSAFVPDQRYDVVVRDGERYRVGVDSRTATEREYRYEVTEVAPDVETFADRVRDRYLFALSGLSDAERAVVEEAIEGAYFEDDEAFRSVADRIRRHDGVDVSDSYGTWLLAYEGTDYLAYVEW